MTLYKKIYTYVFLLIVDTTNKTIHKIKTQTIKKIKFLNEFFKQNNRTIGKLNTPFKQQKKNYNFRLN